jgi:hypothetical protein
MSKRKITHRTLVFSPSLPDTDGFERELMVDGTDKAHMGYQKVSRAKTLTFHVDYPLSRPDRSLAEYTFTRSRKNGWTLDNVVSAIRSIYRQIYKNAEKYGVWGHDISDLVIEEIRYKNGHIRMGIES